MRVSDNAMIVLVLAFVFAGTAALSSQALDAAEFVKLHEGGVAKAVSADGRVIAGFDRHLVQAWRWTLQDGLSILQPGADDDRVIVQGLSSDGTIVAGNSGDEATQWHGSGQPRQLGIPQGYEFTWGWGVSGDGHTIAGSAKFARDVFAGFRWTSEGGMELLDPLPGDATSQALRLSADGSVVVGESRPEYFGGNRESEAVIWYEGGEPVGLGRPGGLSTWAGLVSRDGSIVVGAIGDIGGGHIRLDSKRQEEPVRWSDGKVERLGILEGTATNTPTAISGDASVIVGNTNRFDQSFVWDAAHGVGSLQSVLRDEHGVDDLSGWDRIDVLAMSDDALVLAGGGQVAPGAWDPFAWALFLDRPLDSSLMPGDANQDLQFDQEDLVEVLISGKYLTGESATWGEGDWDNAPKIRGDGVFNQLDIIAAQQAGVYLTGPYYPPTNNEGENANGGVGTGLAAMSLAGGPDDTDRTTLTYDATSGALSVAAPAGVELTSISIDSAAGIFTGESAQGLGGSFDNDSDLNIFKATFGGSFGSLSFGDVAQIGLSEEFMANDLTVIGSLDGGGALGQVDLIYIPEPSPLILLSVGVLALFGARRRCMPLDGAESVQPSLHRHGLCR